MSDDYQLIIPMTGVGQRFINSGFKEFKPVIQTGVGSMIESVFRNYASITSPICILSKDHPQKNLLRREILRIRKSSKIFEISGHKKGPSFAILEVEEELEKDKPSVVNYCDFSGVWSENKLIEKMSRHDGLILTYTGFHPHMLRSNKYAYVKKDPTGKVIDIREKMPFTDNPMDEEASSGTYVFRETSEMIEAIRIQITSDISLNGEFYTSLTYLPLIEAKKDIQTFSIERFFQWGTPEDLRDFQVWSFAKFSPRNLNMACRRRESTTLVLAAGGGTRLRVSTDTPKPLLRIFERELWNYAAELGAVSSERLVIALTELLEQFNENNPYKFLIKGLAASRSSIETAKFGIQEVKNRNQVLHILACDNIIPSLSLEQVESRLENCQMVVWLGDNYLGALGQEAHFSWLETDANGFATKVYFKSKPQSEAAKLIIGNFSFKNTYVASRLINQLISQSLHQDSGEKEPHLEFLISEALKMGLKVGSVTAQWFAAVGTDNEFKVAQYFESAFLGLESPYEI